MNIESTSLGYELKGSIEEVAQFVNNVFIPALQQNTTQRVFFVGYNGPRNVGEVNPMDFFELNAYGYFAEDTGNGHSGVASLHGCLGGGEYSIYLDGNESIKNRARQSVESRL